MLSDVLDNLCLSDIVSLMGDACPYDVSNTCPCVRLVVAVRAHFELTNSSLCHPRALGFEVLT